MNSMLAELDSEDVPDPLELSAELDEPFSDAAGWDLPLVLESTASVADTSDDDGWPGTIELALGPSQIVPDLDGTAMDCSSPPESTPSPVSTDSRASLATCNARVLAMQELLHASDLCATAVRRLRALGVKSDQLDDYTSPYNARALESASSSNSVMVAHLADLALPSSPFPQTETSPPGPSQVSSLPPPDPMFVEDLFSSLSRPSAITWEPAHGLDPVIADLAAQARARNLLERQELQARMEGAGRGQMIPLPRQRKEPRKPSYSTR